MEDKETKKEVEIKFNLHFKENDIAVSGGLESPFQSRFFAYSVVLGDLMTLADSVKEKEGVDSPTYQEVITSMVTVRELASLNKKILAHENGIELKSDWEDFKKMISEINKVVDVFESIGKRFDWKDFLKTSPLMEMYEEFDVFTEDFEIDDLKILKEEIQSKVDFFEGHEEEVSKKIASHPDVEQPIGPTSKDVKPLSNKEGKSEEKLPGESKDSKESNDNNKDILL